MMSKKAKYAINAMTHLALKVGKGPVVIEQIATEENIPHKFLESILLELKKGGLLSSKKGKGGGYYLRKNPAEINIADIIRIADGPIALLPCVSYMHYKKCEECKDETTCSIRRVFFEVRNTSVEILKAATLQKMISK